jgi:crossover junction endodeoxyribonuclease RusA
MKRLSLELPWPPTLNSNVRHSNGRHYATREYKAFQTIVWGCYYLTPERPKFGSAPIKLTIHASPKDRRKRDLDNVIKPVLDSLTKAGVWDDDSQVADLRILRVIGKPGVVNVFIEELQPVVAE